jgi:hypothetical protein
MSDTKTDRELLELAAKAVGLPLTWEHIEQSEDCDEGDYPVLNGAGGLYWNPLTDDGDAFRLAVTLRMDIAQFTTTVRVNAEEGDDCHEPHDGDPYAATRRAIVRAAAAMAPQEKSDE